MKLGLMDRNAAGQPRRVMLTVRHDILRVNVFFGDQCVDSLVLKSDDKGIDDALRCARAALRRDR